MLARVLAILLSLHIALLPARLLASQNQLSSPTTGTVSGLQLTNNYNNALDSVNTGNSGATAPTNQLTGTPSLGNEWINTTSNPYPRQTYDGSSWLTAFWLDNVNHMTNVKIGGGTASVASATTVDPCGSSVAPMAYLTITGNTTITSFGSTCKQGHVKIITFSGVLTLTYNATSLIIPGAANVTTAAGDQAVLVSLGSGNWQVVSYTPANGQALINPAVDVGTYVMTAAVSPPSSKYLFSYGQLVSRTTYATLLANTTITQSVTRTNGSPTLTGFSDTTQIPTGGTAFVEGAGIPASTVITGCTSTTCAMSNNASSSGTANVQIFPNGDGDGSTTFALPNCAGVVLAGRNNMSGSARSDAFALTSTYFLTNPNALGVTGGSQNSTLASGNIPTITASNASQNITVGPPGGNTIAYGLGTGTGFAFTPTGGSAIAPTNGNNWSFVGSLTTPNSISATYTNGSPTPVSHVQPTLTANCMIRVLAMHHAPLQHFAANDNAIDAVALVERRRTAA